MPQVSAGSTIPGRSWTAGWLEWLCQGKREGHWLSLLSRGSNYFSKSRILRGR
jgi:hypothetical protein